MASFDKIRCAGVGAFRTNAYSKASAAGPSREPELKTGLQKPAESPAIHPKHLEKSRPIFNHPRLASFLKNFKKNDSDQAVGPDSAKDRGGYQDHPENNSSPRKLGSKRLGKLCRVIMGPKPDVADLAGISDRMLDDSAVAKLVTRFGDSFHTVLLDPQYKIFRSPNFDGAVGYKIQNHCAVVAGEPLCDPRNKKALAEKFETMCKKNGLTPVYCATGADFAHEIGKRKGHYIEFGEEQVMNPTSKDENIGDKILSAVKAAQNKGIYFAEFRPSENDTEAFGAFQTECQTLIDQWAKAKEGQMHASGVNAFPEGAVMRWFTTRDRNHKLIGLAVLTRLESKAGYYINYHVKAPKAPAGTSESLIHGVKKTMAEENVTYLTWGVTPKSELGEMTGVSGLAYKMACDVYRRTRGKLPDYDNFRNRYGAAKRRDPLYIVFPNKFAFESARAVRRAMGDIDVEE